MARPWSGRAVTQARAYVLERDAGICWLCGHPGANSLDHVIPKSIRPELTWVPDNWKAAHLQTAGQPHGCQHPDCQCIGNINRKAQPPQQPATRKW